MTVRPFDLVEVGNRIRTAREEKGWTLSALTRKMKGISDKFRISVSHLSQIENGKVGLSLSTAVRLAIVLGRSIDWFVWGGKT